MNKNFLDNQLREAYYNYNYFFMKLIVKVLQCFLKLAFVLLIASIFDYGILYIVALFYSLYSIYNIYIIVDKYTFLIRDIRKTLNMKEVLFEMDLNVISNNLFKGLFSYVK